MYNIVNLIDEVMFMKNIMVYESECKTVERILKSIANKAKNYGIPFAWSRWDSKVVPVNVYEIVDNHKRVISTSYVRAVEYGFTDEIVKCEGWTVIAHIEHMAEGQNLVTKMGDELDMNWFSIAPKCEHCGTNRIRKHTFILKNGNGTYKQVAKTCLRDYTGINADLALNFAKICDIEVQDEIPVERFNGMTPCYTTTFVVACAIESIAKYGYVRSCEENSTKEDVEYRTRRTEPSEASCEKAEAICEWIKNADNTYSDLLINCSVLAKIGYCLEKHFGILSFLPVAYDNEMKRIERMHKKLEQERKSEYVGTVGQRITFTAKEVKILTSWDTAYGRTYLVKMEDENGNIYIWFASNPKGEGKDINVTATIKDHNERDGIKQNIVTRCRMSI